MVTISLSHIEKQFGSHHVLNDISASLVDGEFLFLVGASGSGKTTLLRIIAGLEVGDKGTITFDDIDVTRLAPAEREIGFVFQNYALWPHMTVYDNCAFGLTVATPSRPKLSSLEVRIRVKEIADIVELGPYLHRYPHELSGGQQQRVALARALAPRPRVLLLDEPLSNLDGVLKSSIREQLSRIHQECKITSLCVTHDIEDAFALASRIAVLEKGRIVQLDTPQSLYGTPHSQSAASLSGEVVTLPVEVSATDLHASHAFYNLTVAYQGTHFPAYSTAPVVHGARGSWTSRPEHWERCHNSGIPFKVETSSFEGSRIRVKARYENDSCTFFLPSSEPLPPPHSSLFMTCTARALFEQRQ
jgi:ABC-type sulfate/molybdate transport systems ATPase subunit